MPAHANAGLTDADRQLALDLKREGDVAMDNLHYEEAIRAYTRAFETYPDPPLLYNRGRAHQARGEFPLALRDLEAFRDTAAEDVKAKVPLLEQLIEEVRARVAQIHIEVNIDGAEIRIGDAVIGRAPMPGPVRVNAGAAAIRIVARGYKPFSSQMTLPGGDALTRARAMLQPLPRTSVIRIRAPQNSEVVMDGRVVARAPADIVVQPGKHRVIVRRPTYVEAEATVFLVPGETRAVHLNPEKRITSRWWFWTGIGAAVVGGVAATLALTLEKPASAGDGFEPSKVPGP
jgi:hypothetical protein